MPVYRKISEVHDKKLFNCGPNPAPTVLYCSGSKMISDKNHKFNMTLGIAQILIHNLAFD